MQKSFGYKQIYLPNHPNASKNGCVYEHVIIAEKKLGRLLKDSEVVHHIDGNKKNNSESNLMVFATNNDHVMFHKSGKAYESDGVWHSIPTQYQKKCAFCGKLFYVRLKQEKNRRKYCSKVCSSKAQAHIALSSEELVTMLLNSGGNFSSVAKVLNVSSSGLHKRLRKSGLPYKSEDYKNR